MRYYLEKRYRLPGNHDRGPVEEWRRVKIEGTTTDMEWEDRIDALRYMSRLKEPGEYQLVDVEGKDCAFVNVLSRRAA